MPNLEKFTPLLADFVSKFESFEYTRLISIFLGVFIIFFLFSLTRRYLLRISAKGTALGFLLGVILMIIIDLAVIIGLSDKKALEELKKGEKRREAAQEVLTSGLSSLGEVLGVSMVESSKKPKDAREVLDQIFLLDKDEVTKIKNFLCE